MERKQFLKTAGLSAAALAFLSIPTTLWSRSKKKDEKGIVPDRADSSKPLMLTNWKHISDKYLHKDIKNFIVPTDWDQEPYREFLSEEEYSSPEADFGGAMRPKSPEYRKDLRLSFMGRTVEGPLTEERVKDFCEQINHSYELGVIEYAVLMPGVHSLELARDIYESAGDFVGGVVKKKNALPERYLMIFYACSRYTVKEQKAIAGHVFNREGEMPETTV